MSTDSPSASDRARGYMHRQYAESFSEIAVPRELVRSGGWILERTIPGSQLLDGMGCYPIFACRDWAGLQDDLRALANQLVSLTVVADPFGNFTEAHLRRAFDVVLPYKQHHVTDLTLPIERWIGRRHRRNVEKSLGLLELEVCPDPLELLDVWVRLYAGLIERHGITGLRTFSRTAFEKQLGVPGVKMFKASVEGHVVGLHIWYVHDEVAYGHLGATSAKGYDVMASYALYWHAIEHLRARVRWLDLGAAAGVSDALAGNGLRRFKAGWSTGVRQTYLCGRVFQPAVYASLVEARGMGATRYFPAYRLGEFGDGHPAAATGEAR